MSCIASATESVGVWIIKFCEPYRPQIGTVYNLLAFILFRLDSWRGHLHTSWHYNVFTTVQKTGGMRSGVTLIFRFETRLYTRCMFLHLAFPPGTFQGLYVPSNTRLDPYGFLTCKWAITIFWILVFSIAGARPVCRRRVTSAVQQEFGR